MTEALVPVEPTLRIPQLVPLSELLIVEEGFNSRRDKITPLSVKNLQEDIAAKGLDQPIHVCPLKDHPTHKYRVVAGFRRTRACEWLGWKEIPAFVRDDIEDDLSARTFNIRENLQRKDLSLIDEAYAIKPFLAAGFPMKWIAEKLSMPKRWVEYRALVGSLPPQIQDEIAAYPAFFKQGHIEKLVEMELEDQMLYVKTIKEHGFAGESIPVRGRNKTNINDRRRRSTVEINELLDSVYETFGPGIHTRLLAWCAGNISNFEILQDLNVLAREEGVVYIPPENISSL